MTSRPKRIHAPVAATMLALSAGCADQSLFGVETPGRAYWRGYVDDTRHLVTGPSRWGRRDWLAFAGIAATTVVLYSKDEDIRDEILASRNSTTEDLAEFGQLLGYPGFLVPGLAIGYGLGCAADDAKLKEATLLGVEGFILSGLATNLLKTILGRARPDEGEGSEEFLGPRFESGYRSWPSGHTTLAFAVATAFHLKYENPWVSVPAYSLASLAGWSRLHDDRHWASDVFAGATIGIVVTRAIFRARGERGGASASVHPFIFPNGAGVAYTF